MPVMKNGKDLVHLNIYAFPPMRMSEQSINTLLCRGPLVLLRFAQGRLKTTYLMLLLVTFVELLNFVYYNKLDRSKRKTSKIDNCIFSTTTSNLTIITQVSLYADAS